MMYDPDSRLRLYPRRVRSSDRWATVMAWIGVALTLGAMYEAILGAMGK